MNLPGSLKVMWDFSAFTHLDNVTPMSKKADVFRWLFVCPTHIHKVLYSQGHTFTDMFMCRQKIEKYRDGERKYEHQMSYVACLLSIAPQQFKSWWMVSNRWIMWGLSVFLGCCYTHINPILLLGSLFMFFYWLITKKKTSELLW